MLVIKRRRTFSFTGTFYQVYKGEGHPDNVPFNLTGGTARAQIREKKRGKDRKEAKIIANLNPTIPSPTNGVIVIEHTRDFTTALKDRSADETEWDLIFTDSAGKDFTLVPPQPVLIFTPPTNPDDDSSLDFVPGGGGTLFHTHPISAIIGLQQILDDLTAAMMSAMGPVALTGPVTYLPVEGVYFITADATSGNITVTLPPPSERIGKAPLVVKRIDSNGVNSVILDGTVDGSAGFALPNQYSAVAVRATSTGYLVTTAYNL